MRDTGMSLELFIYLEQTNDWFQMKTVNLKIKCISWFQPMGDHTEHPFCGFDQSFVKMTTENMPC